MLPPGIESWGDISNNEAWLAGSVGYTHNAFSLYAQSKREENPIYDSTILLPAARANNGDTRDGGSVLGWLTIFRNAPNIDLAKELALHLLDPANFLPMVQGGGGLFLPAYKNQWTDEVLAIDPNFATLKEIMFNDTAYTGQAYPADPNPAIAGIDAQSILSQMMTNVTTGQMTAEEAVQDAHDKIVQIFEELGLPQS